MTSPNPAAKRSFAQRISGERIVLALAAPVLAVVLSVAICSVLLATSGKNPFDAWNVMITYATKSDGQVLILNRATTYYLAAAAAAFGFRMNLFNIGVEGQYKVAALFAAFVGAQVDLPAFIQIPLLLVTAMLIGGLYASIAGLLKVYRGVSEVISTIMLNAISVSIVGLLLVPGVFAPKASSTSNSIQTDPVSDSSHFFSIPTAGGDLWGFLFIAVLVGVLFQFTLTRTRFGFDLRATGRSESAATASGVNVKKMVVISMVVSGAIAGLIGLPELLQNSYSYGQSFQPGLGFLGISIALLGRNSPIGMAFAALLFSFLDSTGSQLPLKGGFPFEIVAVMQGTIVICVVVAYELVRRYGLKRQQQKVGAQLAAQAAATEKKEVSA
ncbi:ABC transporter permease [Kitasatospora aureofaciens]|uniref:ABC transporter permease n=1 Tax=Kitasatospora aureofaciens TaxID=1894 RepID=A0A1E7N5V8_KITAU|nr:ABC transporter permease [Kitasatospora aureofaciens]QEV01276.1 ABC transporter permease [Streptomyces viridifaciens]ARF80031.1 ABC transporter permease [Kitasatospora aureofaciens]OEV36087.1 sugar ABC transporter permease [Kitasatospora aureofaciens]UKZ07647.1 ABC transporter permease [Streptomyces viridifaciens]GGU91732.1 ABC transporter permease [Kitasatospora aureofaciens]